MATDAIIITTVLAMAFTVVGCVAAIVYMPDPVPARRSR